MPSSSDLLDPAAEALAVGDQDRRLDLDEMALPGREIRLAHQRPVDARRRHFQMIRLVDRIFDIEDRRNGPADLLAILDGHGAVLALGHDLQRQAVLPGQPHAHQAETAWRAAPAR